VDVSCHDSMNDIDTLIDIHVVDFGYETLITLLHEPALNHSDIRNVLDVLVLLFVERHVF